MCVLGGSVRLYAAEAQTLTFVRDVQPILAKHCYACHGNQRAEGGLRLDLDESSQSTLSSGLRAIVPGKPGESEMVRRIAERGGDQMPPKDHGRPLTDDEQQLVTRWIAIGAHRELHWADRPVERPKLDATLSGTKQAHPIDQWIRRQWAAHDLTGSAPASPEMLVRRVYLDLTGLPPSAEEAKAFLQEDAPDAYERLVDRLLNSPAFGERWAAWWLDFARYADSNGFEKDRLRSIWPYRDWVIKAFNDNQPFDKFTIDQLAGDLLPNATVEQRIATGFQRNTIIHDEVGVHEDQFRDSVIKDRVNTVATIWLAASLECAQCHDHKHDPFSQRDYYALYAFYANTSDKTTASDRYHFDQEKFDSEFVQSPVLKYDLPTSRDRLASLQLSLMRASEAKPSGIRTIADMGWLWMMGGVSLAAMSVLALRIRRGARVVAISTRRWVMPTALFGAIGCVLVATGILWISAAWDGEKRDDVVDALRAEISQLQPACDYAKRWSAETLVMREGDAVPVHVQIRGDFQTLGERVEPGVPASFALPWTGPPDRLGLARWLVDPKNPRTPRVIVNRLWGKLLGQALVTTTDDFGSSSSPPSHPELLDWLASEFVESGWNFKHLLKEIVLSQTYRQSSYADAVAYTNDPQNRFFARASRFRLDAEAVRDAALKASGLLTMELGGPPIYPPQPNSVWNRANTDAGAYVAEWKTSTGPERYRRSLYIVSRRTLPHPIMANFDSGGRYECLAERPVTNTSAQALTLWNEQGFLEAAGALAACVQKGAGDDQDRIARAFWNCVTRDPTTEELRVSIELLNGMRLHYQNHPQAASALLKECLVQQPGDPLEAAPWVIVASTLLNMDAAVTRE